MDFAEFFDQDSMTRNMIEHEILPSDFFKKPMQYMAALAIKKEELIAEQNWYLSWMRAGPWGR